MLLKHTAALAARVQSAPEARRKKSTQVNTEDQISRFSLKSTRSQVNTWAFHFTQFTQVNVDLTVRLL